MIGIFLFGVVVRSSCLILNKFQPSFHAGAVKKEKEIESIFVIESDTHRALLGRWSISVNIRDTT